MSAPEVYTLEPVQYLRVLTSGLTELMDSIAAGAERDSLRDDVDALLLLAYQGQHVASDEPPAARGSKKELPKQGPLFAIGTDLEEAAALLRGVLDGLERAMDEYPEPRLTLMRILLDRFGVELARVEKQMHAVYAMNAGTDKTDGAR
jgi:hypothetical protein